MLSQKTLPLLNKELQFLISCTQFIPDEDDLHCIYSYLREKDFNIHELISFTYMHGVLPLIYKVLKNYMPNKNLNFLLAKLHLEYTQIAQTNMLMSAELLRIIKLFEEKNINVVALKGPTLSQLAYKDITLRHFVDLDILIPEKDVYKAVKLLIAHDYSLTSSLALLTSKTCLHTAKDCSLLHTIRNIHTELHWRLFEKKYNIALDSSITQNTYQNITINHQKIKTLPNELLLVYLCLHGAKHSFQRLEWICDIDRLIRNVEIQWEVTTEIALQSHVTRAFYLGLALSKSFFHTPVETKLEKRLYSKEIIKLQKIAIEQITCYTQKKSDFIRNKNTFFFQAQLFDKKSDILRFYLSTIFNISTSDCQTFKLPQKLRFLYLFLRPLRLLYNYIIRIFTV